MADWKKLWLVILVLLLTVDIGLAQCAMCRAVLNSEENITTAKAVNNGIVYLMVIPYILVFIIGWRIHILLRKRNST